MKRKLFLMVFAAVMALLLFSTAAFATDGDLMVQDGTAGTDYTYSDGTLRVLTDTQLTVSGSTTTDKIVIAEDVKAKLTISGLSIDVTAGNAIDLESRASLELTLEGSNTLKAGDRLAGIRVPSGTALTIGGSGSLDVVGGSTGDGGAGIGADRGSKEGLGDITITGGRVTATASSRGSAGIGAGGWGNNRPEGSSITITGGRVVASAFKGDQASLDAETITISGGHVVANAPDQDINALSANNITINGGFVNLKKMPDPGVLDNADRSNCCVVVEGKMYGDGTISEPIPLEAGDSFSLDAETSLNITEDGALTVGNGGTLTMNSGSSMTTTGNGALTVENGGMFTMNGGSSMTMTENGALTVGNGGTLTLNKDSSLSFEGAGALIAKNGSTLSIFSQFPARLTIEDGAKVYVGIGVEIPEEYKDQCTVFQESWLNHADTDWYDEGQTEFTLTTPEELAGLAKLAQDYNETSLEGYFLPGITIRLGNDIDLSGKAWVPFRFSGTFDGQGHKITNLTIDQDLMLESDWEIYNGDAGLFADLEDAIVKDLTISGTIDTSFCVEIGGRCANASDSEISNVHSLVTIAAHGYDYEWSYDTMIGGLIGDADDVSICDCSYQGEISDVDPSAYVDLGGLIGELDDDSLVLNCSSGGKIDYAVENEYEGYYMEGYNANIGGLVGEIDDTGRLYNSFSTMNISYAYEDKDEWSGGFIGGLAGDRDDEDVRLNTCWFGGVLPDEEFAYGIMGDLYEDESGIVVNCWSNYSNNEQTDGYHGQAITTMDQLVKDLNQGAVELRNSLNDEVRMWALDESDMPVFGEAETILQEPTAQDPAFEVSNPDQVETYIWQERAEQEPVISSDSESTWEQTTIDGETVWQSTNHGEPSRSTMNVSYDLSAGDTITFSWKVGSEEGFDELIYSFKDCAGQSVARDYISGQTDWENVTLTAPGSGKYTLSFTYSKDRSDSEQPDCGYVKLQDTYIGWGEISLSDTYYLTAEQAAANEGKQLRCVAVYKDGQRLTSAAFEAAPLQTVTPSPSHPTPGITIEDPAHGTVTVDPQKPGYGDEVTITPQPDEGFVVDKVTVTDRNGDAVEVTAGEDGSYHFTQPWGKVTIEVTFTEEAETPATDVSEIFADIAPNAWYTDAVQYAYDNGLMTGTAEDTFAPNATTTRGMIVAILHRLEGEPAAQDAGFSDVADGSWYASAVAWAKETGIVNGYSDSTFGPNDAITREQMAAILMNYAEYKGQDVTASADLSGYADADTVSGWATDAVQWAVETGLLKGVANDTLEPQGMATRAQVAAILQRFLSE